MASQPTIKIDGIEPTAVNLDQYFGLWAVDEVRFGQMLQSIARMDLPAHVAANADFAPEAATGHGTAGDDVTIGIISITGTLTKRGSSLSRAGSMIHIRRAVREASHDTNIDAILLRIDSPGGTVAGTAELAAEVAAAAKKKPVYAQCEDMTASAAYWIASQASKVFANVNTAMVGSIGTYTALYDFSGKAEKEGIRAVVIRSGQFKGAGVPGTEITPEQEGVWQGLIDKTQTEFTAGVAAGRGLSIAAVEQLADGRVLMAADAVQSKLIDGIQSLDDTLTQLAGAVSAKSKSQPKSETPTMSETTPDTTTAVPAANLDDLKKFCPGADHAFLITQLENKATIDQARTAWIAEQGKRLQASEERATTAEAKATTSGVQPLGSGGGDAEPFEGDARAEFANRVREQMSRTGSTRRKATIAVAKADPALHEAYLLATNSGRKTAGQHPITRTDTSIRRLNHASHF